MTEAKPPEFYFDGIEFNPLYFKEESTGSGLTQQESDARYLIKTQADTATGLETFSGGIKTNSIDNVLSTDTSNILINSTGNINIGTSASRTNANPIQIGTTASLIRFGTSTNSQITSNTLSMSNVQCLNLNSITATSAFGLLGSHTGAINIGNIVSRTGDISIASNQTTGTGNIVLGSTAITGAGSQNITINRPLTIGYSINPSQLSQIGGSRFIDALSQPFGTTGGSKTLAVLDNIPIGIYQVFYNISTTITVATATFTERITTISDRSDDTSLANVFNFMIDSDLLHQTRIVGHNFTITGGGIFVNTIANDAIYLNQRYIYALGPTVTSTGHLRIVRIG